MSNQGTQSTVWHWLYQVGARTSEEAKTVDEIAEATGLDRSAISSACSNTKRKGIAGKTSDFPPKWWTIGDEYPESHRGGYRGPAKPKIVKSLSVVQRLEAHLTGVQECWIELRDAGLIANPADMEELLALRERITEMEELAANLLRKKKR